MASLSNTLAACVLVLATLAEPCVACIMNFNESTDYFAMASQQTQPVPRSELSTTPHVINYGSVFNISYGLHFKVVTDHYSQEQYVLWLCGTAQPTEESVNAIESLPAGGYVRKYFSIPLQKVALSLTSQFPFLAELDLEGRIVYGPNFASSPCGQKLLGCGLAWADSEETRSAVDAVFVGCNNPQVCAQNDPKSIVVSSVYDPSNLGIAEHIKYVSTFFNKEAEAEAYFQTISASYRQSSNPMPTGKTVAWISFSDWGGDKFEVSTAEYKAQYVMDVNANNVDLYEIGDKIINTTGSNATVQVIDIVPGFPLSGQKLTLPINEDLPLKQASEALWGALMGVDVVIDESYSAATVDYTLTDFLMRYGLNGSENLPFLTNSKVFRIDGRISPSNGYDWFGSRFAYPHKVLEDLARAVSTGDEGEDFTFLRNIAAGEKPRVLTSDECEAVNCTAPTPPPSTTVDDDASRGARGTSGPQWELVAGAAALVVVLRASLA